MPFYCSRCLPTISTTTQNISSPAGGEKHQNTEEEEKNIPPVWSEDSKILVVVLTYSGSCLVSREKFCWSVMSRPGSSSILKLWLLFCCSLLRTSDLVEGKKGWSGGLRGCTGLWVLYEVWRPEPVEFLSSSWVSILSAKVSEQDVYLHNSTLGYIILHLRKFVVCFFCWISECWFRHNDFFQKHFLRWQSARWQPPLDSKYVCTLNLDSL